MSAAGAPRRGRAPRWHLTYYVLASCGVCAVLAGLYVSDRVSRGHAEAARVHAWWDGQMANGFALERLARAVSATTRAVLVSGDVPGEVARMHATLARFRASAGLERARLAQVADSAERRTLLEDVEALQAAVDGLAHEAAWVFARFEPGRPELVVAPLAALDRRHVAVDHALAVLHEHALEAQRRQLAELNAAAASLRRAERLAGGLMLLMLAAVTLHGRRSARRIQRAEHELEERVLERTEDLRRSNQALREEIAERERLEDQLRQSQKMEAVGRLAGGVAHDFNNLLGVIVGYGELLKGHLPEGQRSRRHAEEILKAAGRAAGLTRQLLAFSRKQVLQPQLLDLNAVVTGMDEMLRRLIGEDVRLVLAPARRLGKVTADRGQIEQVIMNLAVNARDAMPGGGVLTLETADILLDEDYARGHLGAQPGPYVMLAVSDTGLGMDAQARARAFEPFFTTKEVGKGTGLGLAMAHGIVKQSNGHIWLYSEPGRGTTFKIYLPEAADSGEPVAPSAPHPVAAAPASETILLVEDETALRTMIRQVLQAAGYTVLDAAEPNQALALASAEPGPIDLLLTDVVMPGLSGCDLARRLAALRPTTPTLYMSGYPDEAIGHHGLQESRIHLLQKPFATETLLREVRGALDRRPPAAPAAGGPRPRATAL